MTEPILRAIEVVGGCDSYEGLRFLIPIDRIICVEEYQPDTMFKWNAVIHFDPPLPGHHTRKRLETKDTYTSIIQRLATFSNPPKLEPKNES